jgi:hypothetical protein
MIDCESVVSYGDISYCVKRPSVLLDSIHKINSANAQEMLHPGNISTLVL